ncbi:unnamed protein product [Protopolystoma xenopodis]|uniref:Uncharacterized protein n=1 Tax=Protopolystoma xenopodis TaxID=117903 RepID=A0A3S5BDT8_9PLAT|nr:unnamed protein product [Protopolystoma xenopodis]
MSQSTEPRPVDECAMGKLSCSTFASSTASRAGRVVCSTCSSAGIQCSQNRSLQPTRFDSLSLTSHQLGHFGSAASSVCSRPRSVPRADSSSLHPVHCVYLSVSIASAMATD